MLIKIATNCYIPKEIIEAIVPIDTAAVKRQVKHLEESKACIDLSFSKARRTVVFTKNKSCYLTALAPDTLAERYAKD